MTSASGIPPRQVEASSLQPATDEHAAVVDAQWPSLNPERSDVGEWEMVAPSTSAQVTFDSDAIAKQPLRSNPKILKHCQSSPDLRSRLHFDSEDEGVDSDEETPLFIDDEPSMTSSSAVMVSGPPSVWSVGSNKPSFRDVMLSSQKPDSAPQSKQDSGKPKKVSKARFVVVKPTSRPTMKRNSRSMGNLKALDHVQEEHDDEDGEILGDTDAGMYYNRKAQGALGRKNGMKSRPDEAKRLQISMAKKDLQRQRQKR